MRKNDRPENRDRIVIKAGELTDEEIAIIAQAEVPAEHTHLDQELEALPHDFAASPGH